MSDKKKLFIGVAVVVLVVCLVVVLLPKKSKDKKEEKKDENKTVVENVYELDDTKLETLDIHDIVVESRNSESVLRFIITNNSDAAYPEGMIDFDLYDGERLLGQASTFVTTIDPHDELSVEVVINASYRNITGVKVSHK